MPPLLTRADGALRRVGIEVEFAGLDVAEASKLVQDLFGGEIDQSDRFGALVRDTRWGEFGVVIDSQPLKEHRYRSFLERVHAGKALTDWVEGALETVARQWIPSEIISPPIPMTDLPVMEALRKALRSHHASGTHVSPLYTFALQLNPELPALDAPTINRYLRSFLALHDWIISIVDVDRTRRLTSFIDPFPIEYRRLVLDPKYAPDMSTLIGDYLEANPTRNRALDMLPLFAVIDEERVLARAKEHEQVKPRPTFHYRLPNCLVDEPNWSFALEWNRWVEIERLAEDPERLARVGSEALALVDSSGDRDRAFWVEQARSWGIRAE